MPSIVDMFRSVMPGSQQQANPNPNNMPSPGNIPPQNPAMLDPNNPHVPVVVPNPNGPANPAEVRPPMADFAELFKVDPNAKPAPDGKLTFNIDPAKVLEHSRKASFTGGVTQEAMAKVAAGGPDAVTAMMDIMNTVAQNVFAQAAVSQTKILEQSLDASRTGVRSEMDSVIRNANVTEALRAENALFSVPAAAPLLEMVKDQMLQKFPTASATEIRAQMNSYLNGLSAELTKVQSAANPAANGPGNTQKVIDTDWSSFGVES